MEQFSIEKYTVYLYSNNVNESFANQINQNYTNTNEFQLFRKCALSRELISIPVRHTNSNNFRCIFQFQNWIEYALGQEQNMEKSFLCPGCKTNQNLKGYGVDYQYYNFLQLLGKYKNSLSDVQKQQLDEENVYYSIFNQQQFYFIKNKNDHSVIRIPGTTPILGISKRNNNQILLQQLTTEQKKIRDSLYETITILQNYIVKKFPQIWQNNIKNYGQKEFAETFRQQMRLINLETQQIEQEQDFVFLITKSPIDPKSQQIVYETYLIVYFFDQKIWKEFLLQYEDQYEDQQFNLLQESLIIKQTGKYNNYIYVIGGKYPGDKKCSSDFYKITFPIINKNTMEQNLQAKVERLKDIPQPGYHFMGTEYKGKIYIFHGQQISIEDDQFEENILNQGWKFSENQWNSLNINLEDRYDGSFQIINQKQIVFYGGLQQPSYGVSNQLAEQQHTVQVFDCSTEELKTFNHNNENKFNLQFPDQKNIQQEQINILCNPVFSFPLYRDKILVISVYDIKQETQYVRSYQLAYTLDLNNQSLIGNDLFSLEPPEFNLTVVKKQNNTYTTPIQDYEGCKLNNYFYTLSHIIVDEFPKIFLLRINLANGQFQYIKYKTQYN